MPVEGDAFHHGVLPIRICWVASATDERVWVKSWPRHDSMERGYESTGFHVHGEYRQCPRRSNGPKSSALVRPARKYVVE